MCSSPDVILSSGGQELGTGYCSEDLFDYPCGPMFELLLNFSAHQLHKLLLIRLIEKDRLLCMASDGEANVTHRELPAIRFKLSHCIILMIHSHERGTEVSAFDIPDRS